MGIMLSKKYKGGRGCYNILVLWGQELLLTGSAVVDDPLSGQIQLTHKSQIRVQYVQYCPWRN